MSDYAQTIHGKAAIGGYLSRVPDEDLRWLPQQPGLGYLACPACPGYPRDIDQDAARVRALFTDLKIKYVVVNLVTFEGLATTLTTQGTAADAESISGRRARIPEDRVGRRLAGLSQPGRELGSGPRLAPGLLMSAAFSARPQHR